MKEQKNGRASRQEQKNEPDGLHWGGGRPRPPALDAHALACSVWGLCPQFPSLHYKHDSSPASTDTGELSCLATIQIS